MLTRYWLVFAFAAMAAFPAPSHAHAKRPNLVVIMADDMGFGDCGIHGCKDIPTPNIDSLAKNGVRCSQGYVSAPQCSPTRAGLLTGRYQQRFGHESNAAHEGSALPLTERTLAELLRAGGYVTGLVGKWHLGLDEKHHPQSRGFQEFFGFLGGANPYLPKGKEAVVPRILRGKEDAQEKGFLTEAFGREAVAFIDRHKHEPFFLYLAFNAPHGPLEAAPKYLDRFKGIADEKRRTYAAMVSAMDDAIGQVLSKLKEAGLEENTLVIFLNDNGGPTDVNASSNLPWRGVKGEVREGGIRIPFLMQWKGRLPAGKVFDSPVIQLDILPTVLAAAGLKTPTDLRLDGVDLLPFLLGQKSGPPHDVLYWRFCFPANRPELHKWAIRQGDWKLYTDIEANRKKSDQPVKDGNIRLVNLADDPTESKDLSQKYPEKARELHDLWKKWNAEMVPPMPRTKTKGASLGGDDGLGNVSFILREKVRTLNGHTGSVLSVTFSPDGKVLASGCRDKTIKLWDPHTGKLERTLTDHTADVYSVVFAPKGGLFASGSGDKTVRLWDAQTAKVIRTFEGHTAIVRSVNFAPDQKTLVSAGVDLTIRLWDVQTGKLKQTLTGHTARVMAVVYSPDGKTLASASSDSTARLWDVATSKLIAVLEGHSGGLESVAFAPNGKLLASSSHDGTVRLWDVQAAKLRHVLKGHVGEVDSVSFSPDGKTVVSGCKDKTIKLWDPQTGQLRRTLTGHTGRIESLAFSPDGRMLATGGGGGDTSIRLWHLTAEEE